jgi:hypothetical protein
MMLPIDLHAELIKSFQDEKRQRYEEMRENAMLSATRRPPFGLRLLRNSGNLLVRFGQGLEKLAEPRLVEYDRPQLGEVR